MTLAVQGASHMPEAQENQQDDTMAVAGSCSVSRNATLVPPVGLSAVCTTRAAGGMRCHPVNVSDAFLTQNTPVLICATYCANAGTLHAA
jgi:hypothetical protein